MITPLHFYTTHYKSFTSVVVDVLNSGYQLIYQFNHPEL